jgi:hypothetical protein
LIVDEARLPHGEEIFTAALVTALVSIFAHGLTAVPGASAYGRMAASAGECPVEHAPVMAHPLRVSTQFSR